MPTATRNTYDNQVGTPSQRPDLARMERRQMTVSTTLDPVAPKKFIAVAKVTSTNKLAAYNDANSPAGVGVCIGLLPVKAVSDSGGKITVNGGNFDGDTQDTVGYYTAGIFDLAQITGLDANGLADLGGHLYDGAASDLSAGEIVIP